MLVYLGLISIAFGLVVWAVMNITGTYLINQRVSEEMQAADDLALEVTPYVKSADADQMYSLLVQRGRENSARILILDSAGTVWVDTLSELQRRAPGSRRSNGRHQPADGSLLRIPSGGGRSDAAARRMDRLLYLCRHR